ncbi:hypothetical protein AVEN_159100-1 [Araneus ventricosus]|uniref:Uncharacterized protein n=1 Tax=Araneus ventricosus TaxID=182803 RepID=A0A4Y2BBN6_ARAVE|nr:hypothetical protein AVEN_159100-1 [Araneus ventricosus]
MTQLHDQEYNLSSMKISTPSLECLHLILTSLGGLVVRSRHLGRRNPGSKPDSTGDPPCKGRAVRQPIHSDQKPSRQCGTEVWRGIASEGVVLVI